MCDILVSIKILFLLDKWHIFKNISRQDLPSVNNCQYFWPCILKRTINYMIKYIPWANYITLFQDIFIWKLLIISFNYFSLLGLTLFISLSLTKVFFFRPNSNIQV